MADGLTANVLRLQNTHFAARPRATEGAMISIEPAEALTRFSLRVQPRTAAALGTIGEFPLNLAINRCAVSGDCLAARLGPDEWLMLAPRRRHSDLTEKLNTALAAQPCSLVDISHRNQSFIVAGRCVREVINAACPLDLHDEQFPAGSATRTIFGKAEIVLLRPDESLTYRLECWRSFTPYVEGLLREAAREFTDQA